MILSKLLWWPEDITGAVMKYSGVHSSGFEYILGLFLYSECNYVFDLMGFIKWKYVDLNLNCNCLLWMYVTSFHLSYLIFPAWQQFDWYV